MNSPHVLEVGPAGLRRLERLAPPGALVLSVCFALDPEVPNAATRVTYARGRLDEAARTLEREVIAEEETALEAAVRELRDVVVPAVEARPGMRGVAAYADGEGDVLVFALRRPPAQPLKAAFQEEPLLEPLLEARPGPSWGVLVVNRTEGTVFRGSELGLAEVASVHDDVHRRHSQGGWSQARYERGIDKELHDHVEHACALLAEVDRGHRFEHLVVIATEEVWSEVETTLAPDLRERLAGHLLEDLPEPRAERVLDLIGPSIAAVDRGREADGLERLEERLGTDHGAAAGTADVLEAIAQRKVEALLVDAAWEDESVDAALAGALEQDADVVFVAGGGLDQVGHVAALLRY